MNSNPYQPPAAVLRDQHGPELEAATRFQRLRAAVVDVLLLVIPAVAMAILLPALLPRDRGTAALVAILALLWILGIFIWNIVLLVSNGQTLGKKVVGIRIIDASGENPGFWKIFLVRAMPFAVTGALLNHFLDTRFASSTLTLVDVLFIFGPTRQCLHDYLAGTHVVQD